MRYVDWCNFSTWAASHCLNIQVLLTPRMNELQLFRSFFLQLTIPLLSIVSACRIYFRWEIQRIDDSCRLFDYACLAPNVYFRTLESGLPSSLLYTKPTTGSLFLFQRLDMISEEIQLITKPQGKIAALVH